MSRTVLFGSYELVERIGEGGMAEVWLARSRGAAGFEKAVVIKRVLPSLMARQDFAALLIREAKIAAKLSHPNLVQIFDLGEEQGAYFIAMEHVHGRDLASAMAFHPNPNVPETTPGLPLALRLWIVGEAAKALDYAHSRRTADGRALNIVHRDISPQNILLGYQGEVKVADFGIARADERELGRDEDPGLLRGKYAYMSPEQARGESLDQRSDLFSLGIVLYELVSGRRLFRGKNKLETLSLVQSAEIPPLEDSLHLPEGLAPIIGKVLANDRAARYASAAELERDIARLLIDMGAHVASTALADALERMFPPDNSGKVNKLRVDLSRRADEDATYASLVPELATTPCDDQDDHTHAFPVSRQLRSRTLPISLLVAPLQCPDDVFANVMAGAGGLTLPVLGDLREAVFGHAAGTEEASRQAANAALELRRAVGEATGPLAIVGGTARVFDVGVSEPSPETRAHAEMILGAHEGAVILCDPALRDELAHRFRLSRGAPCELLGYRARAERSGWELRRRTPLVGRRSELEALHQAVVRALQGASNAVLLVAEPGAGKSRMLAELRAERSELSFLVGSCEEGRSEHSYDVVRDLFEGLVGLETNEAPDALAAKIGRLRVLGLRSRDVARVAELIGAKLPHDEPLRDTRPRSLELLLALERALLALSADRPIVLCLEDIQWMDDATRQILPLLARGLRGSRVSLLMTARPGIRLPAVDAERLELPPLGAEQTARLFAALTGGRGVEEELRERLSEITGGNPEWVSALATHVLDADAVSVSDGVVAVASSRLAEVPDRVGAQVVSRVARLQELEREVLHIVAVFEAGVDLTTLAAVQGVPRDVIEPAARRLMAARLVRSELADAPPWHPGTAWGGGGTQGALPTRVVVAGGRLISRAILSSLGPHGKSRLHGRVASALERSGAANDGDRIEQLAWHSSHAGDRRQAPAYLVQSAKVAVGRGDETLAAERYGEAARILLEEPGAMAPASVAALALEGAELALEGGDTRLAERILRIAEGEKSVENDTNVGVRLALARAHVLRRREYWPEVVAVLERVADGLGQVSDPTLRDQALLGLGVAQLESGRVEESVDTLGLVIAGGESDESVRGKALCSLAVALARLGRTAMADSILGDALVASARSGLPALRCAALVAAAEVLEGQGELEVAASRWEAAMHVARRDGSEEELARTAVRAAVASFEAGAEGDAAVFAEEALRVARQHELLAVVSLASATQAALAVAAHPEPGYVRGMVRAIEHLEAMGRLAESALALQMLARTHLALGDTPAAIRTLGRAGPMARAAGRFTLEDRLARYAEQLAEGRGGVHV